VALLGYSVGLLGLIAVKILAPGFYARQDMRTPVRCAFITLFVAQSLAVALMFSLPSMTAHAGLTLATTNGACLNAMLLYRAMRRAGIYAPLEGWAGFLGRIAVALVVLGVVLWWSAGGADFWIAARLWPKVGRLALVVGAGAIVYFGALWLLGFRVSDFNRREAP
jgi:putative peptidoglycan lipid II flippase